MTSVLAAQRLLSILVVVTLVMIGLIDEVAADEAGPLDTVLAELAPPPSGQALTKIPDPGRRLLALRSYLRYGAKIADRWSWTEEQIKAFEGSSQ